jgi:glycosyltransferase involved in cell wall biosynthesis
MHRLAFISTNEGVRWGGSEHCWSAAADKLARASFDIRVSVKQWHPPVREIESLRAAGCRVFYRPEPPSLVLRIKRRLFLRQAYVQHHLEEVCDGADLIVIAQGANFDGLPWMEAALSKGLRYVTISQLANEQWWQQDDIVERLSRCYEAADAAYFVSQANLDLTQRQIGTTIPRAKVIRNPYTVPYDIEVPWPDDNSDQLSLACVARLDISQKGQDLLIQVLDRAHWRHRNLRVTLAGSGIHERTLRKVSSMLGLESVFFAGFVTDIPDLWSRHHALILPSRFEGMPLALVEAMLCARPSIVTDVAGHAELVVDGQNGFLVKAPTVNLLDETLEHVWENRRRLKGMGEQASRDVRRWVSPDPTGDFVRLLERLADGPQSAL